MLSLSATHDLIEQRISLHVVAYLMRNCEVLDVVRPPSPEWGHVVHYPRVIGQRRPFTEEAPLLAGGPLKESLQYVGPVLPVREI